MRKLIAVAVAGLMLASAFTGGADARPGKKDRNDYGKALGKNIAKNEKDATKIGEALDKAGKEKNAKGETFQSLLDAGKLPGTAE